MIGSCPGLRGASTRVQGHYRTDKGRCQVVEQSLSRDGAAPVLALGARTPIGRMGGALKDLGGVALGAHAVRSVLDAGHGLVPDQALLGCVLQAAQGQNPARQAAIRGGAPTTTSGITLNDVCLASMSSVSLGALLVRSGHARAVLVGGFDSMSRAPHASVVRGGLPVGDAALVDVLVRDGLWCAYDDQGMGPQADVTTTALGISRADQDALAAASHARAIAARDRGRLAREIAPIDVRGRTLAQDEGMRADSTHEKLGTLRPAFTPDGSITAGNASQLSDAGAAGIVTSADRARAAGLDPLAWVVDHAVVAGPDTSLHRKPAQAARSVLERHGIAPRDVDLWEINEAFASVVLASMADLDIDHARVNVNGGAISLGHPLGASGFRLVLTLALEMAERGATLGVAAICGGGGQGEAVLLARP